MCEKWIVVSKRADILRGIRETSVSASAPSALLVSSPASSEVVFSAAVLVSFFLIWASTCACVKPAARAASTLAVSGTAGLSSDTEIENCLSPT